MDKQIFAGDDKIISVSDVYYLCSRVTTAKEEVWMTNEDSQFPGRTLIAQERWQSWGRSPKK